VNGVAMTIEENLLIIEADYYQYQTKDLEQFAADLSDWSVEMKTYLAEIKVAELNKKLAVLIENHPNKNVQEILKKMQAKLK
jgi:L-lactate utilization protein LutC